MSQWIRKKNSQFNIIQEPDDPELATRSLMMSLYTREALKVEHVTADAL